MSTKKLQILGTFGSAAPKLLCTFLDAYTAWRKGEDFPIAFYGDSTFQCTEKQYDGGSTICEHLQSMLRAECGASPVVHNAGVRGKNLYWGINNFENYFGENGIYKDAKMVGIGFGINDRIDDENDPRQPNSYKAYKEFVYSDIETLINMFYDRGIQPFLVTSHATAECGVHSEYTYHVLRDSASINICANGAKKELAQKYGIPLLDLNQATESYMINSMVPVEDIFALDANGAKGNDHLHYGEIGRKYEAGYLFSEIISRVIPIDGDKESIVSYTNQNLRCAVPEDKLRYGGDFKVYASYFKDTTADEKIFDAYVFVKGHPATLTAYKYDGGNTYVKIDGIDNALTTLKNDLGKLDLGLHHLEVYSGGDRVVFNGFVLNERKRCDGDIGDSVLLDTTNVDDIDSTFNSMSSAFVPAVIAPNFNAEAKTTDLSGTTVTAISCPFRFTGTLHIGKVNLEDYGKEFSMIGAKAYTIDSDRYPVIDVDPIELGEHETLALGVENDSARLHFIKDITDERSKFFTADTFRQGLTSTIGMRLKVYGKANTMDMLIGGGVKMTDQTTGKNYKVYVAGGKLTMEEI